MKKSFRFLLAFAVLLNFNAQAMESEVEAEYDEVKSSSAPGEEVSQNDSDGDSRLSSILTKTLEKFQKEMTRLDEELKTTEEQHESTLAQKLSRYQANTELKEKELAEKTADLAVKEEAFRDLEKTTEYQTSLFASSWETYNVYEAARKVVEVEQAKFNALKKLNEIKSAGAKVNKDQAVAALKAAIAKQRSEYIAKTDIALTDKIDKTYIKMTNFFRENGSSNVEPTAEDLQSNQLAALLKNGLYNSAQVVMTFQIRIADSAEFEPLVVELLGEEQVKKFTQVYERNQLEACELLMIAAADKNNYPLSRKVAAASAPSGGYLGWMWRSKTPVPEQILDEKQVQAEMNITLKAHAAFLGEYARFVMPKSEEKIEEK